MSKSVPTRSAWPAPCSMGARSPAEVVTADALLTQRTLAAYLIGRKAHYSFTVKGNQPGLEREIALLFEKRGDPDFVDVTPPDHGRIETRRIWCSTALNAYLDFPRRPGVRDRARINQEENRRVIA
ncbi:MAG: hypothetical protein IPH26_03565 [Sterolibacteriaceae bacterium]|uniref:Uncharacterized protein n=1 Tax=Candidatus Methylophosphatis roskildensis TaxID=2899263 RepID=A0A9D7HQ70_9PROT|nr:hypothetical protein [Candidatus Methylophosphatis roskildensis]